MIKIHGFVCRVLFWFVFILLYFKVPVCLLRRKGIDLGRGEVRRMWGELRKRKL